LTQRAIGEQKIKLKLKKKQKKSQGKTGK
jgi:hypothetical protein